MASANSDNFTSFPIWIPFIPFLLWLLWLKLSKLCWIIVVRVGNLVLFLILKETFSVFHHWEWCLLCVCHIWPLLCWGKFPLCLLSWGFFYHKWVLNFVESFLCIYWDDHLVFLLQVVNMVYHIDWFAYIEESLHSWDKPHLIMVYDPFNVLLDSCLLVFCSGLLYRCSSVILACSFLFLWHLCLVLVSGWWWPLRTNLGVFLPLQFFGRVWEGWVLALL